MAQSILRLIHNPDALAWLRAAGRTRVTELMDESRAARRLVEFYRCLRDIGRLRGITP